MIKEKELKRPLKFVEEYESSKDIDEIKEELAKYQAKYEKEKTILDMLLDSHNFFNDLDTVLNKIHMNIKREKITK